MVPYLLVAADVPDILHVVGYDTDKITMRRCTSATRRLLSPALLSLYRTRGVVRWPADRQCPSRKWPATLRRWRSVADYRVRIAARRHIHSAVQPTRRRHPANVGHGCEG